MQKIRRLVITLKSYLNNKLRHKAQKVTEKCKTSFDNSNIMSTKYCTEV